MHPLIRDTSNLLIRLGLNTRYHDKKLIVTLPGDHEVIIETNDTQARGRHKARPKWAVVRSAGFSALTVFPTQDPEKWPAAVVKNTLTMATRVALRSAANDEALPALSLASA